MHLCKSLFFNKVAGLRPETLLKKRLCHRCFPVNFVKFLKTPSSIEHLRWLVLTVYVTDGKSQKPGSDSFTITFVTLGLIWFSRCYWSPMYLWYRILKALLITSWTALFLQLILFSTKWWVWTVWFLIKTLVK